MTVSDTKLDHNPYCTSTGCELLYSFFEQKVAHILKLKYAQHKASIVSTLQNTEFSMLKRKHVQAFSTNPELTCAVFRLWLKINWWNLHKDIDENAAKTKQH